MVDSREQFEKWAEESYGGDASKFFEKHFDPKFMDEEEYKHADVQAAYKAWQASRDAAIEECAVGVVEILLAMDGTNWTYEDVADALRALKGKE